MRFINDRGSATFLIVLIVMVILTVTIGFNWLVREYIRTAQAFTSKAEAMLKARSTYDTVIFLILNGQFTAKEILSPQIEGLPEIKNIPLNGTEVSFSDEMSIKVQDSSGLISLSPLNTVVLGRLLKYFGLDQDRVSIAIDSLLDWIDQDDLKRLNGAEKEYYSSEGFDYEPRNYPIQYKEEFKLIRGFDDALYKKIEPFITILPASGFNPNTAPDPVLIAYLDITEDSLNILKEYMATKPITSDSELLSLIGKKIVKDEGVYFYPSRYVELVINAGKPKSYYRITAGIDLKETLYSPYSIVYWKED